MLTKSRAGDSGVKLEVNEKILDTCTKLMHAIRILVQKSRFLQAEIVAQGKVCSFYSIQYFFFLDINNFFFFFVRELQAQKTFINAITNGLTDSFQLLKQSQ